MSTREPPGDGGGPDVWIGLADVIPLEPMEELAGVAGAYVNVLAWATSPVEFERVAREALIGAGFDVRTIEDVSPANHCLGTAGVDPAIRVLAEEVRSSREVRFDVFNGYYLDDGAAKTEG
jgi:hypothetical protein